MGADQLRAFLEHGNIRNSVNFPRLELERTTGSRIAITNTNLPGTLSHILTAIGDSQINVVDLLNKSRDEIAYNLIDLNTTPPADLLEQLRGIEGVINVRCIPDQAAD
jgi:D-3-phosphoglycerate dehydrogenase